MELTNLSENLWYGPIHNGLYFTWIYLYIYSLHNISQEACLRGQNVKLLEMSI